jgi:hypothetical protein
MVLQDLPCGQGWLPSRMRTARHFPELDTVPLKRLPSLQTFFSITFSSFLRLFHLFFLSSSRFHLFTSLPPPYLLFTHLRSRPFICSQLVSFPGCRHWTFPYRWSFYGFCTRHCNRASFRCPICKVLVLCSVLCAALSTCHFGFSTLLSTMTPVWYSPPQVRNDVRC